MDLSLERDSSALGSLFQQIINDMKNTSPLWEDFVAKAGKLHTCLRAAIQAIAAYLDAFQKIADAATNSRGASKEIGTALTRVCLRHKAVETRLKTFTSAIMDCLVQPLQERIEDWKRTVATIDKDHAKEYKRCRTELKKRSSDTLRLQKKARKGQTDGLQSLMDSHMQDVTLRRAELEEVEKKSLRSAMVEERLRYCSFVHMLQPVVHEECEVMSELGHLQEAMQSIALVTKEPSVLPQASEELIHDAKASINLYPESPGGGSGSQGGGCSNSLGSRKSSVCSISSMNSSGSSNSPGHHHYPRSLSQFVTPAIRLKPGESSDSGFCSSPALTTQTSNATNQTANVSTWPPHSQDGVDTLPPTADRPHTISTAYEKGHQRPPLTVYTFQNPETIHESGSCLNNGTAAPNGQPLSGQATPATQKSPAASLSRPPLPVKPAHVRCSSLERPLSAQSNHRQGSGSNLLQRQCPSPIPAHITKGGAASGGSTRIGRRASINQAKPPPPVRRSSSVTPSPNASVGTFRTSSPAAGGGGGGSIYAQPKLVNSMSSFRTSSPSPNGHAHPLPPTQPKANPNLIAQLNARLSGKQQQQQQQQQQVEGIYGNQQTPGGESIYMRSGLPMSQPQQQQHYDAAAQSPNMRQAHSHQHHQQPQQHYTCPPPLEDPPPPPIYAASASATMPKKVARPPTGQNTSHSSAYAAASSTATLPRNMMQHQQRLQQQQQQQYQQPASIGIGIGNGNGHLGQRPQLPLPQQKLRAAQQQHLAEQQQHQPQQQHQLQHQQHQQHQQRQPPIPSRHSSVQQKIFVSTNPFIQTTAVKFHSPSASPTCGSPVTGSGSGSLASIYATTSRGGHHHQQQQQQQQQQAQQQHYYRDAAGGNSNGGAAYYNHNAHAHSPAHHPNYATSTNIEKTGSIRAKTKAEFLENLNAKLAKQGMSGRAFAVRNLINSKALMYQNPQKLSRPSAQYRRPPTYPNTSTSTNATCEDQC
ncbi:protein MTSS 2 isoform X38 [Drosophila santomea]|uniref:protein MTSS 2 isoform X38 n=1 Tax=Drosophila santomea TaxID=129105 RepID=UPI001CCF3C51|nr:protein MTSS 2 isoform X38 [Drosophila santomea]